MRETENGALGGDGRATLIPLWSLGGGDEVSTAMDSSTATPTVVRGRETVRLGREELAGRPHATRRISISCPSGFRHESEWTGVRVDDLLVEASAPGETTHVVVTGRDDCHVYVPVDDAISGLVAVERDGERLAEPRLVGRDIGGTRSVKGVVEIEAVTLAPGEHPRTFERLPTDESE